MAVVRDTDPGLEAQVMPGPHATALALHRRSTVEQHQYQPLEILIALALLLGHPHLYLKFKVGRAACSPVPGTRHADVGCLEMMGYPAPNAIVVQIRPNIQSLTLILPKWDRTVIHRPALTNLL